MQCIQSGEIQLDEKLLRCRFSNIVATRRWCCCAFKRGVEVHNVLLWAGAKSTALDYNEIHVGRHCHPRWCNNWSTPRFACACEYTICGRTLHAAGLFNLALCL